MTTERRQMVVGGIPIDVVRKEIKNLHVGVYPPAGRVRVATPLHLDDEAIRLAVVTRLGWIRRQQAEFEAQDRQSRRDMVTGESHYFLGRRYRLDVRERAGAPGVQLSSSRTMVLHVRPGADRDTREQILLRWYREQMRSLIPPMLGKWEPRLGTTVAEVRIQRMKTRWGSCNADARRILLNLELIKKPRRCLEYVLVHEMVHLHERHHTPIFQEWMDSVMPKWRLRRDELNRAPLAHEEWDY